ncbi:hypothetical protein [Streptomyces sp. URMC 125]|uniref:hypothetical protein n=1 Tax=Streptomyces sp. URMC 125 TaxID=3423419 RepID=UPI003F1DCF4D
MPRPQPANRLASPGNAENLGGRVLHRLRYLVLVYDAEGSIPLLLSARSCQACVRRLERYAK